MHSFNCFHSRHSVHCCLLHTQVLKEDSSSILMLNSQTISLLKGLYLYYIAAIAHSYKFNCVKHLSLNSPVGERARKAHLVSCSDSHRPKSRCHLAGSSGEFSSLRQYKAQFLILFLRLPVPSLLYPAPCQLLLELWLSCPLLCFKSLGEHRIDLITLSNLNSHSLSTRWKVLVYLFSTDRLWSECWLQYSQQNRPHLWPLGTYILVRKRYR